MKHHDINHFTACSHGYAKLRAEAALILHHHDPRLYAVKQPAGARALDRAVAERPLSTRWTACGRGAAGEAYGRA